MIYVVMKTLGKILQLSTALARCISLAYGLGPRSFAEVSTSSSTLTFLFAAGLSAGTTSLSSFNVSGSHYAGTRASGSFSFTRSTSPAASASIQFLAKGRTISQVESSGSFVVTGSKINSAAATASFDILGPPVGGERAYAIFDVGYHNVHDGHTFSLGRNGSTWSGEIVITDKNLNIIGSITTK